MLSQQSIGEEFAEIERLQSELLVSRRKTTDKAFNNSRLRLNRYRDISPYDDNLIKLCNYKHEYINASLMDNGHQLFIAAQGPLENTVEDFWTMVSQIATDEVVILMLTPLVEIKQGRVHEKCCKYWEDELVVGDIHLQRVHKQKHYKGISHLQYSQFQLTLHGKKQTVHHLYYTNWADHAKPKDINTIININTLVNELNKHRQNTPIVVHCSAGVGRTGTFIALDRLIVDPSIRIFSLVFSLRLQRMLAVQSVSQYRFLHMAQGTL